MFSTFDFKKFGTTIKNIRVDQSLTQKNVRELTGISEEALRKIENGIVIPKYETIELLSFAYKVDLMEVLLKARVNDCLYRFYEYIDRLIIQDKVDEVKLSYNEFKEEFPDEYESFKLINPTEFILFEAFLEANIYYDEYQDNNDYAINLLESILKKTIPSFDVNKYQDFNYTSLELRILLLLALFYAKENRIEESTELLNFCLLSLSSKEYISSNEEKIIIKLFVNISYNYHKKDNHELALKYAVDGIKYASIKYSNYCLPNLLARKGAAEYFLGDNEHINSFKQCVTLYEIQNDFQSADRYKKIIKDMYNVIL